MNCWNKPRKAWLAAAALLIVATASPSLAALTDTPGQLKCHATLTKTISKHAAAVSKAMTACRNAVIENEIAGPCPDTTAQTAIDKAAAKAIKTASKKCSSACQSGVPCIDSDYCPPLGALRETCTAGGKNPFESSQMGFPGPYCEGILGGPLVSPAGIGQCAAGVGEIISNEVIDNVYGALGAATLSDGGACLSAISKSMSKAVSSAAASVAKCRNAQLGSVAPTVLPDDCATADAGTATAVASAIQKMKDAVAGKCTNGTILELDLCGNGVGGTADIAAAQTCLGDVVEQASFSVENPETRDYAAVSVINGAYPKTGAARCGDNVVNQKPHQFLLNGEECDGTDDSACPTECLPPGDTFECTCGNIPRTRVFANGFSADLDNGWSGRSHNSKVTDRAGFMADISNCNCSEFDPMNPATCIGTTSDSVCDIAADVAPRCNNRIGEGTTCDEVGNGDGANLDQDCQSCDAFSANEGDYCLGAQRTCVGGANSGDRCNTPTDCPGGACSGTGVCLADGGAKQNLGCSTSKNCGVCVGGSNPGADCIAATQITDCPGGTCEVHTCATKQCINGDNDGTACTSDVQCTGSGRCAETSDCDSQCYAEDDDEGVTPLGPCWAQADCGDGEVCRGGCDKASTCLILRNGAPLPLSAAGTSVCIDSRFFSNIQGTRDIVTGAHAVNYELRSVTQLSNQSNSRPCPVCGGWCASEAGQRCEGVCTGGALECRVGPNIGQVCTTEAASSVECAGYACTGQRCRFDDDCSAGTCSGTVSPECGGGACRLDLACGGGLKQGDPCRLEADTAFGTTSTDCPSSGANVSGTGLEISWTPLTSGAVSFEAPITACDAVGSENYDCPCVNYLFKPSATKSEPNSCEAACTAPGKYGEPCNDKTRCVGGTEAGAKCDADSDCSGGGTCTGNPRVCGAGNDGVCSQKKCVGGADAGELCFFGSTCDTNNCQADACVVGGAPCAQGTCTPDACTTTADCNAGNPMGPIPCEDACTGGICTQLCVERGTCNGGTRNGEYCATDNDCSGGTCDDPDPSEGACAQGQFNHCEGPGWEFISCTALQVGTPAGCEYGSDAEPNTGDEYIGAGNCIRDVLQCFVNNGAAEGGTTLNGQGDPTNSYSVASFCIPASTDPAVNSTAGLPGPGRIRQRATVVPNFTELLP
jgi:hypothetical protein